MTLPRRAPLSFALATCLALCAPLGARAHAQSITGVAEWAEAATRPSVAKWVGPRVPFPTPKARPQAEQVLVSSLYPVAVHGNGDDPPQRLAAVLEALEQAYVELAALGLFTRFGDGGAGDTAAFDLYLTDDLAEAADAFVDASWPERELDAASAFACLDRRVSRALLRGCVSEALAKLALLELDPAETPTLRASAAAMLGEWLSADGRCSSSAGRTSEQPHEPPFPTFESAQGAALLEAVMAQGGVAAEQLFRESIMLARQNTWEGRDLRASPTLLEATAAILAHTHVEIEDLLGPFAAERARESFVARRDVTNSGLRVSWSALPTRIVLEPLAPFGSALLIVDLDEAPRAGPLRVWLDGELGARWSVVALRLDRHGHARGLVRGPISDQLEQSLRVELDADTATLVLAISNVNGGVPSASEDPAHGRARAAMLTLAPPPD